MLQVASEIVNNPEDKTQVSLIFANQTEDDIILRDELDQISAKHDNFQVHVCPTTMLRCCPGLSDRAKSYIAGMHVLGIAFKVHSWRQNIERVRVPTNVVCVGVLHNR